MAAAEAAAVVPEKEATPTACKEVHRTIFVRGKNKFEYSNDLLLTPIKIGIINVMTSMIHDYDIYIP